jgi:hypothetical protein
MNQFNNDKELARKVGVEYTLAAAKAMCDHLAEKVPDGNRFRFVFCSGAGAEWDRSKRLLFMADTRHIKGDVERGLCEVADNSNGNFETFIVRPSGMVAPTAPAMRKLFSRLYAGVETSQVGRALVKLACEGGSQRIWENDFVIKF